MAQRQEESSDSPVTGSEEPAGLQGGAGPLVPSTSTTGADSDTESIAIQRPTPEELPVSYSAARLQTERGVVELPTPPANIHIEASEVSGAVTGVNYDLSTNNVYHVERGFLTGGGVRELARLMRSSSRRAVRSGSTSGNEAERIAGLLMPGTSSAAVTELGPEADEGEETDFTFPSAVLDCQITALKEDFVETGFFRDLERRLLDQGLAVVVGPTGEGKSSNAIMLCHRLRGEGYLSTYFESLEEIDVESIARYKRDLCVVIDNVFGTSILDAANLGRWSQVLSKLITIQTAGRQGGGQGGREEGGSCGKKSLLLLLLSRDNVFSEALDKARRLPSILKDEASRVYMKSTHYLREAEKKELLKKYFGKMGRIPSGEEEHAILSSNAPIGFPQVCRLYLELQTFHDKPIEFFSKPTAVLLDTLKEMIREDAMVRAALVLLVLQGGSIPLQNLQLPEKREASGINATLKIIKKGLGYPHSEGEDTQNLVKTFGTLCGGLLTQERGRVRFSHDSVRDAVSVVIADTSLPFVAEHFSLSVLSQCILLDDSSTSPFCHIQNQSVLVVPKGMWPLFTKRLVSELKKRKLRNVFTCNLMTNPQFCNELAALLEPDIVHNEDVDCGLNFSFWASMAAPNFWTCLSKSCKFKNWELWQGIIGSCFHGHSQLIKSMHESLQNKCIEDWSIPICSWFGKGKSKFGRKLVSQSRRRTFSNWCRWDNLPVGRHAIPGTVAAEHGHVSVLETLVQLGMPADVRDPQQCTPLMSACSGGQKEVIAFLVTSHKADLTAADSNGSTPLHKLAEGGHDDIACWLVETHKDDHVLDETMNKANGELQTPVMLACRYATKFAGLLLAKGAETRKEDKQKKSCLHFAAEAGEPGLVQKLVDLKAMDVNQVSRSGWSPLHFACCKPNKPEVVQILLRQGAEVKPREKSSTETPVHVAVRQGSLEVVQALVASGTDVLAACESVNTTSPFLLACEKGNIDVVQYLYERKADVFRKDECQQSALHFAARSGNIDTVQYVMTNTDLSVDVRSNNGMTPILRACESGKREIVQHLREKEADLSVVDNDGNTALHWAACSGNVDTVQYVMDVTGVNVSTKNKSGKTPLLLACENGKMEVVKYLRESRTNTSVVDNDGNTVLHWAAASGNIDTVQYLIDETGVSVHTKNKSGKTPLLMARWKSSVEVVKYLRERRADIAIVDSNGHTALHLAAASGNVDTVEYVMDETGVSVHTKSKYGLTPFQTACQNGRMKIVKYLRERQANTTVVDNYGDTALHWAAWSGSVDTVQYVIDVTGVDVNIRNKYGRTALQMACENGKVEVVKYLRERQADATILDISGYTALHWAAISGNVDTVRYLVEDAGVSVNARSKEGLTPLLLACLNGVKVVKYLRERQPDTAAVVDNDGNTALHYAAISGNVDTVRYLVEDAGMKVDSKNSRRKTPLSLARQAGHAAVVDFLKEKVRHSGGQSGPGGDSRGRRKPQCVAQ